MAQYEEVLPFFLTVIGRMNMALLYAGKNGDTRGEFSLHGVLGHYAHVSQPGEPMAKELRWPMLHLITTVGQENAELRKLG